MGGERRGGGGGRLVQARGEGDLLAVLLGLVLGLEAVVVHHGQVPLAQPLRLAVQEQPRPVLPRGGGLEPGLGPGRSQECSAGSPS